MKLKEIFTYLDDIFPIEAAEEWDNSGTQLALSDECKKVMAVIEITESLVDEAIESDVDLIITHHPLFFSNLKSLSKDDPMGRIIIKLIQNNMDGEANESIIGKYDEDVLMIMYDSVVIVNKNELVK